MNCRATATDQGDRVRGPLRVRLRNDSGTEISYRGRLRGPRFTTTVTGRTTVG